MGTPDGVIRAVEYRHKGSEEELWNLEAVYPMQGLAWQPGPNAAGLEVRNRILLQMEMSVSAN